MYQIKHGATTMWECWDLINEDGSLKGTEQGKRPKMIRSFNHYAYGSVCDWLHRRIAGLEALEPGYSHFLVKPMPGGGLTDCTLSYKSLYGEIKVLWEIKDHVFYLTVTVPANSRATIVLPDGSEGSVGSGTWDYSSKID
jgi:alpha-L-rhamnosidase